MSGPTPSLGWRTLIKDSWPAVTASNLLSKDSKVWAMEGLEPPDEIEAMAWAVAGRFIRYGTSLAIRLPAGRTHVLPRLALYLHRLRMDATQGLLRSPWLNATTMAQSADLIIMGRPQLMWREFATSSALRPTLLARCIARDEEGRRRTILANGHGDLLQIVEDLQLKSCPFAIIIDTTALGCADNTGALLSDLTRRFSGVPLFALGHTGAVHLTEPEMHAWNFRLGDSSSISDEVSDAMTVASPRDPFMDSFVKRLSYLVWSFRKVEETSGASPQQLASLRAIERAFRGLNVPFPVAEGSALENIRGGRFAIRPVARWIEVAKTIQAKRGDIEDLLQQIISTAEEGARRLETGTTGRAQLILQLVRDAVERREHIALLVGSVRDAEVLRRWVEGQIGADCLPLLSVGHMDGAKPSMPVGTRCLVFAAPLFPSRMHWLSLPTKKRLVLCHPFEQAAVVRNVNQWWSRFGLPSALFGDKCRLWSLDWPTHEYLTDSQTEVVENMAGWGSAIDLPFDGEYAVPMRVVEIDTGYRHANWLDDLLTEPAPGANDESRVVDHGADIVIVYLEGHADAYRWSSRRQMLTLAGDELAHCITSDLKPGDELIVLSSSDDRVATQRELFDLFASSNHGLEQTLRIAAKWQEYVDAANAASGGVAGLTKYLKAKKFEITSGAVQHWVAGKVIGPQKGQAIKLLADLSGEPGAHRMATLVERAIGEVRAEHRRIGVDIRKAIAVTRSRDVGLVKIGSRSFPREVFDSMVEVVRVTRVEHPPMLPKHGPRTLAAIANSYTRKHEERIYFTSGCERSMSESPFENHVAFEGVLDVMVGPLFDMYLDKNVRLNEVEERLAAVPAEYAGEMSSVTKGKYPDSYFRTWQGRKIDISRHIKLGRRHDPRYTMRIHFHWDEDSKRIVVHHAGNHLPTARS